MGSNPILAARNTPSRTLPGGGLAERSKAHAWKACRGATPSRVRTPQPPPRTARLGEPAVEERAGGGDRERTGAARPSMSEAGQPETLPVGDHRRHLRCVIVLVIELPGDEERRAGNDLRSSSGIPSVHRSSAPAASRASGSPRRVTARAQDGNSRSKLSPSSSLNSSTSARVPPRLSASLYSLVSGGSSGRGSHAPEVMITGTRSGRQRRSSTRSTRRRNVPRSRTDPTLRRRRPRACLPSEPPMCRRLLGTACRWARDRGCRR